MKVNLGVWFEIYVQDMQRAKAFYETVLQTQLDDISNGDLEMWSFPMTDSTYGCGGALVKMQGVPSGGSTLIYFGCEDCAVEAQRAVQQGGSIFKPKVPIGTYGYIALIKDTEGNILGLHSMS